METLRTARTLDFTIQTRYHVYHPETIEGSVPALILLHGQGMSGEQIQRLIGVEAERRIVVAPDGPYPFEKRRAGTIEVGYGWYLYTGDQADFRAHLERSERHVLAILDAVTGEYPVDPERTTLLGYSQGGYLAGFVALRNPARFRRLVLMSTRFKHEFLTEELARGGLPATLAIHSTTDPATGWETARESLDRIEQAGGELSVHLHDEGHRIPKDISSVIEDWLGPT